ncbi:SDR family oxidoreductase [Gynuella sunshinyii]|uniref:Dehydrogenases with different specificities (Related to short-chain alcohol dehydrogenase) n=1 Tax=Gynuella sunshinyii YC6258 TaxID=1445510 RepID=A0A0C5VLG3_9GAMM|nr:SDR family oxidoreductase [Gynuella sunshinyii]AJQ95552.1 dehydrogenases with different specificities (related to short-chain alcohol dehydrogenase) [Gynuella sunshinyii YC6258]
MSEFKKTAIVTGASRGIGAGIARQLAQDGFAVVVNYAGNAEAAQSVAQAIESSGGQAMIHQADVADSAAVTSMFDAAETAFGGVDVLINNAGIMALAPLSEVDNRHINQQIDINLKGTIHTLREASNRLRQGGRIVNLSTSVVGLKLENYGVYAATKAAVETLTAIMAKEMRGRDITVNAVAPGPTATDLFMEGKSAELIERMAHMSPLERLGTPQDIASVVAFLCGPDSGWINGQVLRANGGII